MRLFVKGLPYDWGDGDLKRYFEQVGLVLDARVIVDRASGGSSRGFGFVTMDETDARKALEQLNHSEVAGRRLLVEEAFTRPR